MTCLAQGLQFRKRKKFGPHRKQEISEILDQNQIDLIKNKK
jgi:hypothetical protein